MELLLFQTVVGVNFAIRVYFFMRMQFSYWFPNQINKTNEYLHEHAVTYITKARTILFFYFFILLSILFLKNAVSGFCIGLIIKIALQFS